MVHKIHDEEPSADKAKVTLTGAVEKIIPANVYGEPEKAQITVETEEHLFRDIRIENNLQDEAGNPVSLKKGAEVEVTIEAKTEETTPKK
ncbi:MAG: hypothetical protein PVS2B2_23760 [Candidatus Acidiferrum sp.]